MRLKSECHKDQASNVTEFNGLVLSPQGVVDSGVDQTRRAYLEGETSDCH